MSALETYLRGIVLTHGLLHSQAVRACRTYIKMTKDEELRLAIRRIKDPALLRALWECGLTTRLQSIVLSQLEKIIAGEA